MTQDYSNPLVYWSVMGQMMTHFEVVVHFLKKVPFFNFKNSSKRYIFSWCWQTRPTTARWWSRSWSIWTSLRTRSPPPSSSIGPVPWLVYFFFSSFFSLFFYRTRVRSLAMLVTHSLTHSLTHCCLVNLIDVTLAFEDAYSKLVEVVTVTHVDDEKRADNSLVQIWKVKFGHKVKFLSRLWAQGFKVWSRFWSWCWGKILKLKFGHYSATDAWLWLWSLILVAILRLGLVKIFQFKFCRNADVWLRFLSWCLVEILKKCWTCEIT